MPKNTCDGEVYIHNLSTFIKSHERQLANALVAYKKLNSKDISKYNDSIDNLKYSINQFNNDKNDKNDNNNNNNSNNNKNNHDKNNISIDDEETLTNEISKPVRLSLSLHHLYFILGKFQELGISVGPMNLRLDNIDSENNSNYVSFLSEFQRSKKSDSDNQSIHSISSVKSVMSSVSALWNTFNSNSKIDNTISDLKYLYSAFSKLPCLRLSNEKNSKLIEGHEEFPFETSTPILIFKNILVLEISDLDPKEIFGWNVLSLKLRYLVIKKANIIDPIEIFINLVNNDSTVSNEFNYYNNDFETNNNNNNNFEIEIENDYNEKNSIDNNNNNKITKCLSNIESKNSNFNEKRNSISSSTSISTSTSTSNLTTNLSQSHSSMNLVSSLSNNNQKSHHISPNLHQSQSFLSSHNLNNYYNHNHNHNYSHYHSHSHSHSHSHYTYNYHYPLSSENISNYSTSPTASFSSNYHPNRLYAEDMISANSPQSTLSSSVHSTRRSYYYKPTSKSRRSRGSTSMIISSTNNFNNNIHNKSDLNLTPEIPSVTDSFKKFDDLNNISDNHNNDNNNYKSNNNSNEKDIFISNDEDYWKLLKHLSLTENKIEKISLHSFDNLTNLTLLDLSYNKLTQIPNEPLSKLVNLKTLNLSFNKLFTLEKFPKSLKKLTFLNLRGNKLSQIDSIENLSSLQKIDLRQNKLYKVNDLKPLLLLNKDKVLLNSVLLSGNPVAKGRSYRIELFNLFNGVDYSNDVKIDGSRPGIFESRMLLDEKTSKMRFNNYMDESIINRMTASVSNMNLNSIINHKTTTTTTTTATTTTTTNSLPLQNSNQLISNNNDNNGNISNHNKDVTSGFNHIIIKSNTSGSNLDQQRESLEINHPLLDHMTTSVHNTLFENQLENNLPSHKISISPNLHKSSIASIKKSLETNKIEKQIGNSDDVTNDSATTDFIILHKTIENEKQNNICIPPNIASNETNHISPSPSILSVKNPVTISFLKSNTHDTPNASANTSVVIGDFNMPNNCSIPHSQRASNDFSTTSSITTSSTNADSNPIARLSLASPALPVITQATTTTMTITNIPNSIEPRMNHNEEITTPKSALPISDYFSLNKKLEKDENKENESNHTVNEIFKMPSDELTSGLKINVPLN